MKNLYNQIKYYESEIMKDRLLLGNQINLLFDKIRDIKTKRIAYKILISGFSLGYKFGKKPYPDSFSAIRSLALIVQKSRKLG